MGDIVRDPRLLPYYLTPEQVAAVAQLSVKTVMNYCRRGILKRGTHWTRPAGQRRFFRDAVLGWLEERDAPARPTTARSRLNLALSPDAAKALDQEAHSGL